jgi:hypothetical protein
MKHCCQIVFITLLCASFSLTAQTLGDPSNTQGGYSENVALRSPAGAQSTSGQKDAELLESSREAGLLTDWHLQGRFGHGGEEFTRAFAPEMEAKAGHNHPERCELVFPQGQFTLPPALAALKGVFYASSTAYLGDSGEWNVYLESGAEAAVFVDGREVLASGPKPTGVLRGTIHAGSGYHSVMVKFTAKAAPFRVAILPPNSGSRRKNNTPYLQASPASEVLMAKQMGEMRKARS